MPVKRTLLRAVGAGVCLALAVVTPAVADQRNDQPAGREPVKVSSWRDRKPPTRSAPAPSKTKVVVRYKPGTSASRKRAIAQRYGTRVATGRTKLQLDVLQVRDSAAAARELNRDRDVLWAEPLSYVIPYGVEQPEVATVLGVTSTEWTGQPALRGGGQIVGVIDTGVDATNPDLSGRVLDGGAFDDEGDYSPGGTTPSYWHGTAVAALIAGDADGDAVTGTAPEARVRAYRALDADGGTALAVAAAIIKAADDAAEDAQTQGAPVQTVVNMSLGGPYASYAIRDALTYAGTKAPWLLFVAAAGNEGALRPSYPAGFPGVFSVGALEPDGAGGWQQAAEWSNAAEVDLLAPGVVRSWYDEGAGPYLDTVYGTSFASPLVAGLAADLYARFGAAGQTRADDAIAAALKSGGQTIAAVSGPHGIGVGSGRASGLASLRRLTGTTPFATVFVDNGSAVGYDDATHLVRAVAVTPGTDSAANAASPTLSATAGGFVSSGPSEVGPTSFAAVRTDVFRYAPPASGSDYTTIQRITAQPALNGTAQGTADQIPVAFRPQTGGGDGHPGTSGTTYSFNSATWPYDSYGITLDLPANAQVRYTVTYPGPNAAPLFVWAPEQAGGVADVYGFPAAWHLDPNGYTVNGTGTFTAPYAGRYVFGFVPWYETVAPPGDASGWGTYTLKLDTPVASVTVPSVVSSVSTTSSFPVSWSAPGTGNKYNVEYTYLTRNSSGTWVWAPMKRWYTGTTTTSASFTGSQGMTYYFRVQAVDAKGNTGPWTGLAMAVVPYDERSTAAKYSGSWSAIAPSGRYYTTVKRSAAAGAYVQLAAYSARFMVVGDKCASCGQIKVYVDGKYLATVDTYSSTTKTRQVLYTTPALSPARGMHTLKVVVVGTSGRPYLLLDAIGVQR